MAGISDKAVKWGYAENKYRFIGQLYDDDLGWDAYQMEYRTMDPQVGRFWQVDPLASKYAYNSTYDYAEDRVVNGKDLEGKEFMRMIGGLFSGNANDIVQGAIGMQVETDEAMQSSYRIASGTSGQADSHLPGAVQEVINTADKGNDIAATFGPALDIAQTTLTFASMIPAGEAGLPAVMAESAATTFSADAFSGRINLADNFSLKTSLTESSSSGLGDLTNEEVSSIQNTVDQAGRPLEVVGSAAKGTRRGVGSDLPIGKGPGTKSDIDYITNPAHLPYFMDIQHLLPGIDPLTGVNPGAANPYMGPAIRFEPGSSPSSVPSQP